MAFTVQDVRAAFSQPQTAPVQDPLSSLLQGGIQGFQLGQQFNQQQSQQQAQEMQQAQLRNQGAFLVNQQLASGISPDMDDPTKQAIFQQNLRGISPDALAQFGLTEADLQDDIQGFSTNPSAAFQNLQSEISAGQRQFAPKQDDTEIRKETRGEIRKGLGKISDSAAVVKDNFGKLENLVGQIKKGNRSAVGQALVAIAKLGDPSSVVSRSEANAIQNAESPVAAAIALFSSKGDEDSARLMQALERSFDPQNPELIDTDSLLATGQALVSSAVPSIQSRFAEAEEQAQNLTAKGRKSLFTQGLTNRVRDLSNLLAPVAAPQPTTFTSTVLNREVSEQDIQDTLKANPNLTRQEVLQQLGIQ